MPDENTASMVDFAGLFQSEDAPYTDHDAQTLDSFLLKTSWPGLRLLPAHGETSEGEIQIARLVREAPAGRAFTATYAMPSTAGKRATHRKRYPTNW